MNTPLISTLKVRILPPILATLLVAAFGPDACSQLAMLDKGHQLLVDNGLQIWGCDTGASSFTYANLTNANFNAVMWSHGQSNPGLLAAGQKWGKWVDYTGSPATALNATETAHYADLVAIQVGDEQQTDIESPTSLTTEWFQNARAGNHFNDRLLYINSFYINDDGAYATFLANANPDAISFDAYPFGTPAGIQPINWLGKAQQFRRHALGSYINPGSPSARPYGLYLQTYSSTTEGRRDPGDLEMRWQQFTAWTLGYTFVDCFTVGGATSLFNGGSMASPNQPRYDQFKESSRQSMNLGSALTRLISYSNGPAGGGTSIVRGRDPSGNPNPLPISWKDFSATDAPTSQQYLTGVSAVNLGTRNNGQPGDVYVGFFNPLHASFGDPAGTAYFMITNALGAYLQDPTLLVTDTTQQITLDFNFGASGINSLQRLSRDTGQVEILPLTHVSGDHYRYVFNLDGGTGDLFKYNDGSPFVGIPFSPTSVHWDGDGAAAGNNAITGAGLGGSGTWNSASSNWYNGAANAPWAPGNSAVFFGNAGAIELASPQSVNSLHFKTTGYTLSGSTLTLTGPTVTVDAAVTATISSSLAGTSGLVKSGPGTLNLAIANSYSGGTTINQGVLGIISNSLGANPASPAVNVTINNGATLRFNQNNLTLTAQRQILLGPGGGVLDTAFVNGISGVISGSTLTKTGTGTLTLSATNTHNNTVVNAGALRVSQDGALGAVPPSFTVGNITLDGGALRFGSSFSFQNNRGIILGPNGGTIDTQQFNNGTDGYNALQGGFSGPGDLTKLGIGVFFASATSTGQNTTWKGRLIIKEGTWKIVASDGLPYNMPAADGVQPGQVTLDGGTWQMGATINVTNGRRGITVASGGGTIDTQTFNLTWAGPMAGSDTGAVFNKIGSGMLRFTGANSPSTYNGIVNINEGMLRLDNGITMGPLATVNLADVVGTTLNVTGNQTIGSLAGGGASGGDVTLSSVALTTGGNNKSTTFGGRITGSGALVKAGNGTLTLAPPVTGNTYSGGTTVTAGTLLVNSVEGEPTGSGPVVVHSNATLGGTGSIFGPVTLQSGAHLAPGHSIGSLYVGPLTLAAGSILDFELDTIDGVDTSDLVNVRSVGGLNIVGGTLNLTNAGNMTPGTYKLIEYDGSFNGSIENITLGAVPVGFDYELVDNAMAKSIDLVVTSAGDFNADGNVNAADYVAWRKGGPSFTYSDYESWKRNFGRTMPGGGASTNGFSNVPELSCGGLISIAIFLLFGGRYCAF